MAPLDVRRLSLDLTRVSTTPLLGFSLRSAANLTVRQLTPPSGAAQVHHGRVALSLHAERAFGEDRLLLHTTAAAVGSTRASGATCPLVANASALECLDAGVPQYQVAFGGPVTAPGYDYHTLRGGAGISQHVEWQTTVGRLPLSLGRFGRSSVRVAAAPWVHLTAVDGRPADGRHRRHGRPASRG